MAASSTTLDHPAAREAARPYRRHGPPAPLARCRDLERAAGIGVTTVAMPGQTIVVEGDPLVHCFRIVTGSVRLYKSIADGRRQMLDFLGAEECFGFVCSRHYTYSVEAIGETTLVRYPRQGFEAALQRDALLARHMFALACAELERAQRQLLLLGRQCADEKVAAFLLHLVERRGDPEAPEPEIQLAMSRQDMADYLGLTIETVSRTLTRFRSRGLIALPCPQRVVIRAVARLHALAEGTG